jgi:GNAT superfamily N-acetyltransferase
MLVARDRRRRGVGSALMAAAIAEALEHEPHKLSLSVSPQTRPRSRSTRSSSSRRTAPPNADSTRDGELRDLIDMG